MRDLLAIQGVWFAGAAVAAPDSAATPMLTLMRVGQILIGLSYGITKWIHSIIYSG